MAIFERHFTVQEANELLPRLRQAFAIIRDLDAQLGQVRERHLRLLESRINDIGGPRLHDYWQLQVAWRRAVLSVLSLGVLVKDVQRGLVDFPHLLPTSGREVFLCWELAEGEVAFWHGLDSGYNERRPVDPQRSTPGGDAPR